MAPSVFRASAGDSGPASLPPSPRSCAEHKTLSYTLTPVSPQPSPSCRAQHFISPNPRLCFLHWGIRNLFVRRRSACRSVQCRHATAAPQRIRRRMLRCIATGDGAGSDHDNTKLLNPRAHDRIPHLGWSPKLVSAPVPRRLVPSLNGRSPASNPVHRDGPLVATHPHHHHTCSRHEGPLTTRAFSITDVRWLHGCHSTFNLNPRWASPPHDTIA